VGWQAGDLCVHCGQAVRRDVRCFWCVAWTPAARFCRHCGAETVDERLFGAARMLKDAGTDRFTVPKMLRELDPEQVENFTRIYQRQGAVVARHIDDLRLCERHLRQAVWSATAEDALVAELPWDAKRLAAMAPPEQDGDEPARLRAIHASSPLPIARTLAALALLRHDDEAALADARAALAHEDPAVQGEAALILAGWRAQTAFNLRGLDRQLAEILRAMPGTPAAVRLAWLSRHDEVALPADARDHADAETAFTAALVAGDRDRLRAALAGDALMRIAAGCALVRLGESEALGPVLTEGPDAVLDELLHTLASAKAAAPALEGELLAILTGHPAARLRERAARVLIRSCRPGQGLRIAELARDDRSIWQSLLQSPAVGPEDLQAIGLLLVRRGRFSMNQYGMSDAAKDGRMPIGFVQAAWAEADGEARHELCRFVEAQLGHRDDEALHRFLMHVVFGDHPAKLRAAAWWSLHRWYKRDEHRGEGPLALEPAAIRRFFGTVADFVPRLSAVLSDHATLKEVGLYDRLAALLGYGDAAIGPELIACPAETLQLVRQLLRVMAGEDYHPHLRSGAAKALLHVAGHPLWRGEVREAVVTLQAAKAGMYELEKLAEATAPK